MNKTAILTHGAGAIAITLGLASVFSFAGIPSASYVAAAFASGAYYGREQSQAQTKIANRNRTSRQGVWWRGWTVLEWGGIGPVLEWVVPTSTAIITAIVL